MKQVENGLLPVKEQMPCTPHDIKLGVDQHGCRYIGGGVLGRYERELAAEFLLSFSHREGRWVGLTRTFIRSIVDRVEGLTRSARTRRRVWGILNVLTLGIVSIFRGHTPSRVEIIVNDGKMRWGGKTYKIADAMYLLTGIDELVQRNMIRFVPGKSVDQSDDVFFPTPLLVKTIRDHQARQQVRS